MIPCFALTCGRLNRTFLGFCLAICEVEPFIGIPKGKDEGEMQWIAKDWDLDHTFFCDKKAQDGKFMRH